MSTSPASEVSRLRARVQISGRVQGVGFRFSACLLAQQRRLSGWVQNRPDGRVEIMAEGEEAAVQALLAWCHRGPSGAAVTDVQVMWEPYRGEFQEFRIIG